MSFCRHSDGLIWSSLFSIDNKCELSWIQKADFTEYQADILVCWMAEKAKFNYDGGLQTACERVALKFCLIQSNFAQEMLTAEELEKAQNVYARKQYDSKVLKKLLAQFNRAFGYTTQHDIRDNLKGLFYLAIHEELQRMHEEETDRAFAPLKKVVNAVAAGVKGICYLKAEDLTYAEPQLDEKLNQFLIDTEGYDYNSAHNETHRFFMFQLLLFPIRSLPLTEKMFRRELLDDHKFWEEHPSFKVVNFINAVACENDQKHAEKILKFLFSRFKEIPGMEPVLRNQFPIPMVLQNEISAFLEERTFRFTFGRFEMCSDLSLLKDQAFCYPISKVIDFEEKKKIGEQLFGYFIKNYSYPKDGNKVMKFLRDAISHTNHSDPKSIGVILDYASFSDRPEGKDKRMLSVLYPECFSAENIWNRIYLKSFGVTLLSQDLETRCSFMHEIFYDVLKTVEQQTGIATVHQTDDSKRNQCVAALQNKLSEFGVSVGESFRFYYLVSLLDRKIARINEAEHFAELEQLGDAIYGFAVAEILFYSLEYCTSNEMSKVFENLTRAETQVQVSHKTRLNQFYLSAGFAAKYPDDDSVFFDFHDFFVVQNQQSRNYFEKEKYLADSLEMILGAVCKEHGVYVALDFAKKLLRCTFGEKLPEEVRPTDENKGKKEVGHDYWNAILPAPFEMNNWTVVFALQKLLLVLSLGTDTSEKRNFITHNFGDFELYSADSMSDCAWLYYEYLHYGLEYVLEKHQKRICNYASKKIANKIH